MVEANRELENLHAAQTRFRHMVEMVRDYAIYTLDPDGKDEPERLPGQDPARSNTAGAYSPDGKKLVMVCSKPTLLRADGKKGP